MTHRFAVCAVALLVLAGCSSDVELGEAPVATETAAVATEATRGANETTPTPAVSTVTPEPTAGQVSQPEQIGADDVTTGDPQTWLIPARRTAGDIGLVNYAAPTGTTTESLSADDTALRGFTPDGHSRWVKQPTDIRSCPEDSFGTRLGIAEIGSDSSQPMNESDERLLDIHKIHRGPTGYALLEYSCGKYGGPAGLVRVANDGTISDFQEISNLGNHLWMWAPRWGWTEAGELMVVVPTSGHRKTAIDNYIVVESGEVIEKVATDVIGRVTLSTWHEIQIAARTAGGWQIVVGDEAVWTGEVWDYAHDEHNFIAVGPTGGVWVEVARGWDDPVVTVLDQGYVSVAISPNGQAVAFAARSGVELIGDAGVTRLAETGGFNLAFSSDGSQLTMFGSEGPAPRTQDLHRWDFEHLPADAAKIGPGTVISSAGLGPLRVGMTIAEIEAATGIRFNVDSIGPFAAGECFWGYADELPDVSVLGHAQTDDPDDAMVMIVDVTSPVYPTPSGVRVGDATEKVLGLFPDQINVSPHTYTNGSYLDFVPQDEGEQNTVRFTTMPGGQVDEIRGGVIGWTQLVEGCA